MSEAEIQEVIEEVLAAVQGLGGHDATTIDAGVAPIGQLEGFDSLVSIEATVLIEDRLGVKLDTKSKSIFISDDKRSLTLDEVVKRVATIANEARS